GVAQGIGEGYKLALVVADLLSPEHPDDFYRFGEAPQPDGRRLERKPIALKLGLMPAGTDAELETAAGKVVNGHGRVGQDRWMPEAGAVHQRADPYSCGPHCQGRVTGDGLETITVGRNLGRIEVVPDADPIEAELFRAVPQVEQLADGAVLRARVNAE